MPTKDLTTHIVEASRGDRVVVLWEGGHTAHRLPAQGQLVVGRAVESDLWIDHPSVSRKHAIVRAGTHPTIEDAGSRNGIRVGNRKLEAGERLSLEPGVVVEIGIARLLVEREEGDRIGTPDKGSASNRSTPQGEFNARVTLVARSNISLILVGETGVGKEVLAQRIHDQSLRASAPFVGINCASVPENLIESELFGFEKGAFSGATQAKAGIIESAEGGTLFLDEVAELSLSAQAKLLRVVERREVARVGALRAKKIDVRFLSATHRDLRDAVTKGTFREDLYFRLNGMTLAIRPLRERANELVDLARQFILESSTQLGRAAPDLSREAIAVLSAHRWPGNIRELRNVAERAVVLAEGNTIDASHIVIDNPDRIDQQTPHKAGEGQPLDLQVAALEKKQIEDALDRTHQNQTQAAKLLGITRRALIYRMELHGIRPRRGE